MSSQYRISIYHQQKLIGQFETAEQNPELAKEIITQLLDTNAEFDYSLEKSTGETRILESSPQGIKVISKFYHTTLLTDNQPQTFVYYPCIHYGSRLWLPFIDKIQMILLRRENHCRHRMGEAFRIICQRFFFRYRKIVCDRPHTRLLRLAPSQC